MPPTFLHQARIRSDSVLWDRWPVTIDIDNRTVRLESRGRVDEEWSGVDIEQHSQSEWLVHHPELGDIQINVVTGCNCRGPLKTDTRGRPL